MDNFKVIRDMTRLMMEHDLHKGAPLFMVLAWCEWAVNAGHVEYIYDGDEMIGFVDWIRSKTVPIDHDYQDLIDKGVDEGDVVIGLNCVVVRGKDTFRRLFNMTRDRKSVV